MHSLRFAHPLIRLKQQVLRQRTLIGARAFDDVAINNRLFASRLYRIALSRVPGLTAFDRMLNTVRSSCI